MHTKESNYKSGFIRIEQGRKGKRSYPFISFSRSGGHVRIAACIATHGDHVDIQVDYLLKRIRVKKIDGPGIRINIGGVFTRKNLVNKFSFGMMKTIRVELILEKDGWYYGNLPIEFIGET
nr:hypothetical protein [Klebsiella aerogenes]